MITDWTAGILSQSQRSCKKKPSRRAVNEYWDIMPHRRSINNLWKWLITSALTLLTPQAKCWGKARFTSDKQSCAGPTQTQVACWQRVHLVSLICSARIWEIWLRPDSLMGPQMQAVGPRPVCMMYARQMDRPLVFSLSANRLCAIPRVSVRPWIIAGRPCLPLSHPTPTLLQINAINTYFSPSPLSLLHPPSHRGQAECCGYG